MRAIGSACIRVAREVRGCAEEAVAQMLAADARGMLLLSRPGLGKTTMLRDAARLLSERGFSVGIADERHELAACMDGVPTLDVGARSDVADGCPKSLAMERLVRSMAPDVIVTDEIGNARDAQVLRETARRGVRLVASAHASGFGDLRGGMLGALAKEGVFSIEMCIRDSHCAEAGFVKGKWAVKKEQKRGLYDRDYRCVVCRGLDSGKLKVFSVPIGHNL